MSAAADHAMDAFEKRRCEINGDSVALAIDTESFAQALNVTGSIGRSLAPVLHGLDIALRWDLSL